jgi:(p)ppGpp synthase/HD superfamily hydrolase
MKNHVIKLALEKRLDLDEKEIDELVVNVFDIKFADRIHNLSTQWDESNTEKVRRKIDETKEYFLNIAYEINPEAYKKLKTLILELELKLAKFSSQV